MNYDSVSKIDYIAIYPNKKDINYSNAFIVFRDSNDHPFVLYAEKINSNTSISQMEEYIRTTKLNISKKTTLEMEIIPGDEVFCKIIDLSPPKEMTKKEIEELLGYKIRIVE